MGVEWSTDSAEMQERRKWETTHGEWGPPGRTYTHQDYPIMLFKASRPSSGGAPILEHETAEDSQREAYYRSQGYIRGATEAIAQLEAQELEIAKLAAERAYVERTMSPKAQAEAAVADAATIRHVPEVKATPIRKRRGRPAKVAVDG